MEAIEKAILVGVNINKEAKFQTSMEELANLTEACGVAVSGELTQNLPRPTASHYIGTGKTEEIKALVELKEANVVIFNDELSPSQIRNLEATLECKVIDRTMLILDIFAVRAKTRESQLQVEIASLQYMLPRLVGLGKSLGRQSGGVGTKTKGAGETKLELDKRRIENNINVLNKELEVLVSQRQTQRKQRKKSEIPTVSLVGYTNAGKSTLMNALLESYGQSEGKEVFEKDMLFATLETAVRHLQLPDNKEFLLTDTVGFVDKLPHHLVKAFRSTLEEVAEADLLLHVIDRSNEDYEEQIKVTEKTLKNMGVSDIPMVYVYNKSELAQLDVPFVKGQEVYLSAKNRNGIDELISLIEKNVFADYVTEEFLIPYNEGQLVSYFNEHAHILTTEHVEEGTKLTITCKKADADKYSKYIVVNE
ncbi:GTPase HflX [Salipaludibacillus sp. CF4.18]|uniref:GTPase HflX n=1 Tax=Salipaludibacillus sp. CF4.18 TaxID=3373081 RepID=UPI003EE48D99